MSIMSRCRTLRRVLAVLAATMTVLAACSASHGANGPASVDTPTSSSGYDGDLLDRPLQLRAADLSASFRSTTGSATTLAELGSGKLMLLYFGYTHCPDVCPTTMADLGQALRQVPTQTRFHTQVVFVTSDPARDSPGVMKAWLGHFDSGLPLPFVGLTASIHQIDTIATSIGVPLSPPVTNADGSVTVQHGAQTMAFRNGKASLLWLAGTTPAQYAHDIAALLAPGGRS